MISTCNICNQNIGHDAHYLFDKIHCSIRCKNIYKKMMDERNFGPNELYYEREYTNNLKRKTNSFPLMSHDNNMEIKKRNYCHNSISCPNYMGINGNDLKNFTNITNVLREEKVKNDLQEIVIHKSLISDEKENNKKGYLEMIRDLSLGCINYLMK